MTPTVLAPPSKKDQLLAFMQARQVFRTHDVIQWGVDHYFNRALREKGAAHHAGLIRELTDEEVAARGLPKSMERYYEWVGKPVVEPSGQLSLFAVET